MDMQTKSAAVEIKTNSTPGEFTAVISAIGNVDRQKDRVMPGAFKSAIDNDPIPPVYWAHQHLIPPIGDGQNWAEKGNTIEYEGTLFVSGDDEHPYAKMVYAGMKSRNGRPPAINQFSYTYGIPEDGAETVVEEGKSIRNLHVIRPVLEVGPCFIGANPETYLVAPAKSADDLVVARRKLGRQGIPMKQLLAETFGVKDYGDIEGYALRMLLDMLDDAISFIQWSENDTAIGEMQTVANTLLGMVTAGFAEVPELMARGEALDAILRADDPSVEVDVTINTASAETVGAKLAKKDDEEAADAADESEEADAGESAGESETTEEQDAEVDESEDEAADEESADESEGDAEEDETGDSEDDAKSANAVSSDDSSTVSNDEIARLVNTWPSH
jgi:hypothetical protein